jgi:pimeloyl-ACP methyl ester carboxylesterase
VHVTTDDGVQLATLVAGPVEAPGLLLVHGIGAAKEDFADHVEAFARDHRVVTFDHRGHGESDAPDDPDAYSLDRLAADTQAVIEATELRDLRLLGHSMGGMVVRRLVLAAPAQVAAVIFMDTSAGAPPGLDREIVALGLEVARTQGLAVLKELSDELDLLGSPSYQRVLAERPGFREYADYKWNAQSPVMWAQLVEDIVNQPDQLLELAGLDVPVLGIVGDEDATFLQPTRDIVATVPGAELVVVPGAGHSPQFENPPAWREAMMRFLASVPREPASLGR